MSNDETTATSGSPAAQEGGNPHFLVVGIGASAGGITALKEFFGHVTADSGIAFVVILHLSPQHESNLAAVIQAETKVPVTQVTQPVKLEPNHVYVIPPTKYLGIDNGHIKLVEPERLRGGHTSIDLFFRSLGDAYQKDAVAIVLSGTGADGTLGLRRVKEAGGFAIAQGPAEAEYEGMPRNAIDTGLVDLVLPVAEMPARLRSLGEGAKRLIIPEEEVEQIPEQMDFGQVLDILALLRRCAPVHGTESSPTSSAMASESPSPAVGYCTLTRTEIRPRFSRPTTTSASVRAPKKHCARPIGVRMSSSRCLRTSCATRSPPCRAVSSC